MRGVNALLPDAVAVLWSRQVAGDFHARYSAVVAHLSLSSCSTAPVRPALGGALRSAGFTLPLDRGERCARPRRTLVGEHDFSAFRSSECQAKTPVRTLHALDDRARAATRIDFVLRANAFLHHMVRNIVGTLVYVGKGKQPPAWVARAARARSDRSEAAPTFGAEGSVPRERSSTMPQLGTARNENARSRSAASRARDDARAAAQAGADAIGLVFYPPSPRYLSVERAVEIRDALPPFVQTVALFVNADARAGGAGASAACARRCCSFTATKRPEFCAQFGLPFVKACRVTAGGRFARIPAPFFARRGVAVRQPSSPSTAASAKASTGRSCRS